MNKLEQRNSTRLDKVCGQPLQTATFPTVAMISFLPKMETLLYRVLVVGIMDADVEMNDLERPQDDDDDKDDDSDNEYDTGDDGAARALLTQNTQTHVQSKPATGAAATLWNQIGGIVVEVRVFAPPFLLLSDPETPGATDTLIHHRRPPIHW